jgi:membrane protein YdbS with pleckstrin-like domain
LTVSDKPTAGIAALAVIAPIMVLCCAAPLFVASVSVAVATWLAGIDLIAAAFIGLLSALIIISFLRWRKCRSTAPELLVKDKQ